MRLALFLSLLLLSGCSFSSSVLPPGAQRTQVDLQGKNLDRIPAYVFELTELEELDISNNPNITAIPAEIRHLSQLRVLHASHTGITGLPAEIGQLSNLEELDVSDNRLTGLPYELGNLQRLKRLALSGNPYAEADLAIIEQALPPDVRIEK